MPLTPLDIHNKEFKRSLRGYNEDEVNDFLDRVIKDYEALIRQNKELEERCSQMEEQVRHFKSMEESLSKSIMLAQETAEDLKVNARKEAQLVIREAEKNADRIVQDALNKARRTALELDEVKKQAAVFRARFRSLMQAQTEMLESTEWDKIAPEPIEEF
ncbi:DivIVA domain-containing protein [Ferroacidibacillus organovorans]|uniref:Cell division protein DivIVA n=1 Tax=Ferroacidibacillus organovorans TaxID=1765683 RepID=A0A162UKH5_9BACL|nr:DivIVA domain-containing protein [Ferroacidibacillus organovorans]KYP81829.1 cell division protein DivIVA [Ferroacidibacillus organovorans]OAG94175.1 cell division protein DivIVA [Ferroacidibacillus organovorans]OPG16205.1 cell division protein DivIVA [Ferroacidibacillus organovorans]